MGLVLLLGNGLDLLLDAVVRLFRRRGRLLALFGHLLLDYLPSRVHGRHDVRGGALERRARGRGAVVAVKYAQDEVEFAPADLEVALSAPGLELLNVQTDVVHLAGIVRGLVVLAETLDELVLLADVAELGRLAQLLVLVDGQAFCAKRRGGGRGGVTTTTLDRSQLHPRSVAHAPNQFSFFFLGFLGALRRRPPPKRPP